MGNTWESTVAVLHGSETARDPGAVFGDEGDSTEGLLLDRAAEKLRGMGYSAADAAEASRAVLAVIGATDAALARQVSDDWRDWKLAPGYAREALRMMAIKLVQAPKPRFSVGCFLLAAGFDYAGVRSQREWAELQGMSHEHASNEVEEWQRMMWLPRTSAQKSAAARNAYQDTNGARKKGEL